MLQALSNQSSGHLNGSLTLPQTSCHISPPADQSLSMPDKDRNKIPSVSSTSFSFPHPAEAGSMKFKCKWAWKLEKPSLGTTHVKYQVSDENYIYITAVTEYLPARGWWVILCTPGKLLLLRGVSFEAQKANRITSRVPPAFRGWVIVIYYNLASLCKHSRLSWEWTLC